MTQKGWSSEKTKFGQEFRKRLKASNSMLFSAKELWEVETHQEFCLMMRKPGTDTVGIDCDLGNGLK